MKGKQLVMPTSKLWGKWASRKRGQGMGDVAGKFHMESDIDFNVTAISS